VQESAGVIDISGSAKYEISGKDATAFLDRLSCNKLPRVGRLGLSLFHAPGGGIMCEMSITRLDDNHYYLVSAIGSEHKDLHWMQSNDEGFEVNIANVTDDISSMLITGPSSREILQQMTEEDLSNQAFPWLCGREIMLDSAMVRVLRVSYAGELARCAWKKCIAPTAMSSPRKSAVTRPAWGASSTPAAILSAVKT
jgi:dimethylglycine dehydrogenase